MENTQSLLPGFKIPAKASLALPAMMAAIMMTMMASLATSCCKPVENEYSYDKVLILYEAGFNSLSGALKEDIEDVKAGYLPGQHDRNAVVVVSQFTEQFMGYQNLSDISITRLYRDRKGGCVADTLFVMPAGSVCTRTDDFRKALETIRIKMDAEKYGLLFSSHGSGWVPPGYYDNPDDYLFTSFSGSSAARLSPRPLLPPGAVPYRENDEFPGYPRTKSIGQSVVGQGQNSISYELDIKEFAEAIPMHLEYILFDACLMANVEVAYELKDVCDYIVASSAEVMDRGFDYTSLCEHLVKSSISFPKKVCEDFFRYYDSQEGLYRSATISLIDCGELTGLAQACRAIFENHRNELEEIDYHDVQRFYRSYHRWFFDLEDVIAHCNPSPAEKEAFDDAMSKCILFKAATDSFIGGGDFEASAGFYIRKHSGLTSYLPCAVKEKPKRGFLDSYYRKLAWNKASSLVK